MSTEAQKRASTNYNRKQDSITIRPSKEVGAAIRAAAAASGKPLQVYILQAVYAWMEQESTATPSNIESGSDASICAHNKPGEVTEE